MNKYKIQRCYLRSETGALGSILLLLLLVIGLTIGAMAVDIYHMQTVITELQSATDAGALAGAQDLYSNPAAASVSAETTTALNFADGKMVSNTTPGSAVYVEVIPPALSAAPYVKVTAQMQISHLLAPIFGRQSDVISVSSVAGRGSLLNEIFAGQGFPLAVSWDASGDDSTPLSQRQVGQRITFYINSQRYKNSAWTSLSPDHLSADKLKDLINDAAGVPPEHGNDKYPGCSIPSVYVGEPLGLNNGVLVPGLADPNDPANRALTAPDAAIVTLPVITGNPAYNQTLDCVGFIGFKIESITTHADEDKGFGSEDNGLKEKADRADKSKGDKNSQDNNQSGQVMKVTGILLQTPARGTDLPSAPSMPEGLPAFSIGPVVLQQ